MYYLVYGSMAGDDGERWVRRLLCSLFGPVPMFLLHNPAEGGVAKSCHLCR